MKLQRCPVCRRVRIPMDLTKKCPYNCKAEESILYWSEKR